MKVKITIDQRATPYKKANAVQRINRELRAKASIAGDVVTVESGYDERKVVEILDREGLDYSKSSR